MSAAYSTTGACVGSTSSASDRLGEYMAARAASKVTMAFDAEAAGASPMYVNGEAVFVSPVLMGGVGGSGSCTGLTVGPAGSAAIAALHRMGAVGIPPRQEHLVGMMYERRGGIPEILNGMGPNAVTELPGGLEMHPSWGDRQAMWEEGAARLGDLNRRVVAKKLAAFGKGSW